MSKVFHREARALLPLCVGGKGAYLIDATGKQYLDASGGAAVSILGHGDPRIIAAICDQARTLAFAHTAFFANEPSEELASRLVNQAPDGLEKVYFVSGGSEANETALKLARQYHVARGEFSRTVFLHRRQSYHGATLATLSVSGNKARRAPYEPMLTASPEVAPCYAYRERRPGEAEREYSLRAANDLERAITETGAENIAAFIMEPVVGATLGAVPCVPGYYARIREICDRHGILLIADEIMCGMGRTGSMFASAGEGVTPDLLTIAKGLGAGYQPIGAVLVRGDIFDAVHAGPGKFEHGFTYVGHAVACAAAVAVQRVLVEDGLVSRVPVLGEKLHTALTERFGAHPHVGDIRGRGAFFGMELVSDRDSKEPFAREAGIAQRIKSAAMDQGLIIYPGQGTADGTAGDHVLIAPPYIWGGAEIEEFVTKLQSALATVFADCHVAA